MNYVLIGDIHSQADKLENALNYIRQCIENPCVVFLGDIFDSRCEYSDSKLVYSLVRDAEKNLNGIVLQSNHQDKLIRYLKGNKVQLLGGLDRTIQDIIGGRISQEVLYKWLLGHAFGVVFKDSEGTEYRCAHSYFNSEIQIQEYTTHYLVKTLSRKHKHQFLYGITDSDGTRTMWWENDNSYQNYVRVAGHYHTVYTNLHNKSLVIDSGCGSVGGKLTIFDVNSKNLHQF